MSLSFGFFSPESLSRLTKLRENPSCAYSVKNGTFFKPFFVYLLFIDSKSV